jgi:phosphoenolpyruvate---glycerone phosphotransferase subunit DhaL
MGQPPRRSFRVTSAGDATGALAPPSDLSRTPHALAGFVEGGSVRAGIRARAMSATWARAWLRASAAAVAEQRERLTELDAAIGDGDHGINLDRGLRRVLEALDDSETAALPTGDLLEWAGRVIMGSVGGASGALYGRALQRAGAALNADAAATAGPRHADAHVATSPAAGSRRAGRGPGPGGGVRRGSGDDRGVLPVSGSGHGAADPVRVLALAFHAAVEAIAALGRAAPGDKTMLDALVPASLALHRAMEEGDGVPAALSRALEAATRGMEATRSLVARRGRASYLGERSAGHLDPGAASSLLFVRALVSSYPGPRRERPRPVD